MSTVYLARDPVFEREVALKLLPREFLHDPTFIARFSREAKAIANIEHSAIVPVYDFGEEQGQPFLVLRHMTGGSLSDRLKQGRLSIEEAEKIISRLARALNEAHQRGMIHRDIKPGNVLFDQYGDAFLTDFGIVKLTQETATYTGGAIVGTPAYMSPEQARGDRDIDARSDVYALGAMLFEMLTGRPPYESETFMGLAIKHINDPVPSILSTLPSLPPRLDKLIQRAMSKDREDRFDNALELADTFQGILRVTHETIVREPISPEAVVSEAETDLEPTEAEELEPTDEPVESVDDFKPTVVQEPKPVDEPIEPEDEYKPTVVQEPEPVDEPIEPEEEYEPVVVQEPESPDEIAEPDDEYKPTVVEEPAMEEEIEEPETVLKVPTPEAEKKPFKLPKWTFAIVGVILIGVLLGIFLPNVIQPAASETTATSEALALSNTATSPPPEPTPLPQPSPTASYPDVVGEDPSPIVGAFYYPWYRRSEGNEDWFHWLDETSGSTGDILSDYYPLLEPYSSMDPFIVAQHFAWLRQAGIGFIVSSWWGQGTYEDEVVPLLLDMGERYGIRVAFHLEPYPDRSPEHVISDVRYLYEHYGEHPAFYRTAEGSLWIPDDRQKGLFFLRGTDDPFTEEEPIDSEYWLGTIDAIHDLPEGGIVIAESTTSSWIYHSHFDGIYNYTLPDNNFEFAVRVPLYAWYVPGVSPGFSGRRTGWYPDDLYLPRDNGETYHTQWQSALFTSTRPELVIISSFNQWNEGTQIEPALPGLETDEGRVYEDYGALGPEEYLFLTKEFVHQYQTHEWPPVYRAQIQLLTTSDWTDFRLVEGGRMLRPLFHFISEETIHAGFYPNTFFLRQELERAQAGEAVELFVDILITDLDPEGAVVFEIERGHEGRTEVQLWNFVTDEPILIDTFLWAGVNEGDRNAILLEVPASLIIEPPS